MKKYISLKAPAKINLAIDVLGKREDGYHDVDMIMQSLDLMDTINIKLIDQASVLKAPNTNLPTDESNIAFKAWQIMQTKFSIPYNIEIVLNKKIPVGAGLAGGSTDAAAVFKGVNELFDLKLSVADLQKIGSTLGADIPFCIKGGTARATGIGTTLTDIKAWEDIYIVLVNPGFHVSTAEIYQNLNLSSVIKRPDIKGILAGFQNKNWAKIWQGMYNVLADITIKKHPEIMQIINKLNSLGLNSLMSGTGPTVFGLTKEKKLAQKAYKEALAKWPWAYCGKTLNNR